MSSFPETIDHRWDVLYRDYPEVYEEFASFPYEPVWIDLVKEKFLLVGKVVADVGSGSGRSTFALAQYTERVIGIEPETAMRALAEQENAERGLRNVEFRDGDATSLPLPDDSVDLVMGITSPIAIDEALRVLRPGGLILQLDIAPDWYGGELNVIIDHPTPDATERSRVFIEDWGFSYIDYDCVQEYGTTDNVIRTYGFIFGRNAIDHLRETGKTSIRWRFRIHFQQKERPKIPKYAEIPQ